MKKPTLVIVVISLVILAGVLVGGFFLWLLLTERTFVRMAPYHVTVRDKSWMSGKVYSLGTARYLVILKNEFSEHREPYDVDLARRKIGQAEAASSKYIPFSCGAFVDGFVREGYPLEGCLTADWLVREDEVRIRITGFPGALIKAGTLEGDPEVVARSEMPIAYQAEIILRNAEWKGNGETHKATESKERAM